MFLLYVSPFTSAVLATGTPGDCFHEKNNFQFTSSFLDHAPHASCVPGCARNSGTQVPVKLTLHIPRRHAHGTFTLYSGSPDPSSGMFASGCRSKVRKEPASKQAGKPSLCLWILCVTRSSSGPCGSSAHKVEIFKNSSDSKMHKPSIPVVQREALQTVTLSGSLTFWFQRALIKGLPVKSLPDVASSHSQVERLVLGKGRPSRRHLC